MADPPQQPLAASPKQVLAALWTSGVARRQLEKWQDTARQTRCSSSQPPVSVAPRGTLFPPSLPNAPLLAARTQKRPFEAEISTSKDRFHP